MTKLAIVYDWMDKIGGAERMLKTIAEHFPNADWYTAHTSKNMPNWAKEIHFQTSFMQKLPESIRNNRKLSLPFYPFAFESFNFGEYSHVLSISSSFAKGILTRPETKHVSYIFTPTRFLWHESDIYKSHRLKKYSSYLKQWDTIAAQRPDVILTLSNHSAERLTSSYSRTSIVVRPPFESEPFDKTTDIHNLPKSYYLVVSRLEPYKRIDLIVETAMKTNSQFVIVGKGSQKSYYQRKSPQNITWLEDVSDAELSYLYRNALALIMPQDEDFGYTALESVYCGTPVISYKDSAVHEILGDNYACYFNEQSSNSLCDAIAKYQGVSYTLKEHIKKGHNSIFKAYNTNTFIESVKKYLS